MTSQTIKRIQETCAGAAGVATERIWSKDRHAAVVIVRHAAILIAFERSGNKSYDRDGVYELLMDAFHRNRSTIWYAKTEGRQRLRINNAFRFVYKRSKAILEQSNP